MLWTKAQNSLWRLKKHFARAQNKNNYVIYIFKVSLWVRFLLSNISLNKLRFCLWSKCRSNHFLIAQAEKRKFMNINLQSFSVCIDENNLHVTNHFVPMDSVEDMKLIGYNPMSVVVKIMLHCSHLQITLD